MIEQRNGGDRGGKVGDARGGGLSNADNGRGLITGGSSGGGSFGGGKAGGGWAGECTDRP
eukprot:7377099-Prymnesium_polylepis.1